MITMNKANLVHIDKENKFIELNEEKALNWQTSDYRLISANSPKKQLLIEQPLPVKIRNLI